MEYGLIGESLRHSFSKEIHEEIGKYNYELVELDEAHFHSFMENRDFKAINVTIPYKEKVFPYLHYISDDAKEIHAVNTIINKDGLLYGYNTDYLGLKAMLNHFNITLQNKKVMILGTGGTSKTAYYLCKKSKAKEVIFVSTKKKEGVITYDELPTYKTDVNVIINTTPKEMYPNNNQEIISLEGFDNLESVIDVIFNPLRTNLILKAIDKKVKYCSGLYMLIAQAFFAIELFKNTKLDKKIISRLYYKMMKEKQNIVLIGMPSCGKSTIAKKLSKNLLKNYIDSDKIIEKRINMKISDYFSKYGEEKFREIESEVIFEISKSQNVIIATGGGAILNPKNIEALRQNGIIYFIDRPLDKLTATKNRPLSSNIEDLAKLYNQRYNLYLSSCDYRIDGNRPFSYIIKQIKGGIK